MPIRIDSLGSGSPASLLTRGHSFRKFTYENIVTGSTLPGIRNVAGVVERARVSARDFVTTGQVNKIWELCENFLISPFMADGVVPTIRSGMPIDFRMIMNAFTVSNVAGECFQGIEIGSFNGVPPFSTTYAANFSCQGVIQFRYNFALSRWEIFCWNGDAVTPTVPDVVVCNINPTFTPDNYIKEVRMNYQPNGGINAVLDCYVNGELVHSYQSAQLDELAAGSFGGLGCGYFFTTGSNALNNMIEGTYYMNGIYQPWSYPVPANLP